MTVIHPRISATARRRTARSIIKSMVALREKRFYWEIDRREFLKRWSKLRNNLRRTPEYQAFVNAVYKRADGRCERCDDVGRVVHHKRAVARYPRLALVPKNGELLCHACHTEEHPWMMEKSCH